MNEYIKNLFKGKEKRYQELVELNENIQQMELKKRPFLIEFLGSARSGKSTSIELIADVFRKNGFKVLVVDEESVKVTKEINENRKQKMGTDSLDYTNSVIEEKVLLYDTFYQKDADIIIFDRGINDEFIWLNTFGATNEKVEEYDDKLKNRDVDMLIILTCDVVISLERKYFNSLSILPNKWTNEETLTKYLNGLESVSQYLNKHAKKKYRIDSSNKDKIQISIQICNEIMKNINLENGTGKEG